MSQDLRAKLRAWVAQAGRIDAGELGDDTPILENRIITSVQLMDLILFIEETTGRGVDVEQLKPGAFRDIDAIVARFGGGDGE